MPPDYGNSSIAPALKTSLLSKHSLLKQILQVAGPAESEAPRQRSMLCSNVYHLVPLGTALNVTESACGQGAHK